MEDKKYLTYDEAARIFNISKGTLSKWARKGLLYAIPSIDAVSRKRMKFFRYDDVRLLVRLYNRLPLHRRTAHFLMPIWRKAVERKFNSSHGRN